jgi:hypothetical protein
MLHAPLVTQPTFPPTEHRTKLENIGSLPWFWALLLETFSGQYHSNHSQVVASVESNSRQSERKFATRKFPCQVTLFSLKLKFQVGTTRNSIVQQSLIITYYNNAFRSFYTDKIVLQTALCFHHASLFSKLLLYQKLEMPSSNFTPRHINFIPVCISAANGLSRCFSISPSHLCALFD